MSSNGPSHCVLVVDDEPNIVDVISMALRFQGFTVAAAGTGAEALAAVSDFKPDLIVLDAPGCSRAGASAHRKPRRPPLKEPDRVGYHRRPPVSGAVHGAAARARAGHRRIDATSFG